MGCDGLPSFHLSFISSLPNANGHGEPWRKMKQSYTYMAYLSLISSLFSCLDLGVPSNNSFQEPIYMYPIKYNQIP